MSSGNELHYLKLAYLAETAIVFNLAFIELKWKKEMAELVSNTRKLDTMSSTGSPPCCAGYKCKKCTDPEVPNGFHKFNIKYLSSIQKTLISDPTKEINRDAIYEIWEHSPIKKYKWFHLFVNKKGDKILSIVAMLTTTLVLILCSFWEGKSICSWVDHNMINLFAIVLMITLVTPGILWYLWRKFLLAYECLGYSCVSAYQQLLKAEVSKVINKYELPSLNIAPSPTIKKVSKKGNNTSAK